MSNIKDIKSKLSAFKKRYYTRQIVIGTLLFFIIGTSMFLIANGAEHQLWMSRTLRTVVFFVCLFTLLYLFIWLIAKPFSLYFKLKKGMTDEAAAAEVSRSFPEIKDKLLNTLQLSELAQDENRLLEAAIDRKARGFSHLPFRQAVDFSMGKGYAFILGAIVLCLVLVSFIDPSIIKDSTKRIINFHQEFAPEAPFDFNILNPDLIAFRGEGFELSLGISGRVVPDRVTLKTSDGIAIKLQSSSSNTFTYRFLALQNAISFQLEAAGFYSSPYEITVHDRPDMIELNVLVKNPDYTGGEQRSINNSGDIKIPEGSTVFWQINTLSTDSIQFRLGDEEVRTSRAQENSFVAKRRINNDSPYEIHLYNEFGENASSISHFIEVIKDEKPVIDVTYFPDTTMFRFITLAGHIVDDYGFSSLKLHYQKEGGAKKNIPLELSPNVRKQSFYANWNVDSLQLGPGGHLEFFVSVSDNDGVNGAKTTKSQTFILEIPDPSDIEKIIDEKSETVKNQIDKSKKEAESINARLEDVEEQLKTEQKFDWQERKQLNDVMKDREKLKKQIEELQNQHKDLQRTNDQFNKRSEQVREQDQQLQNLLDELLDKETRELYEELKKLLEEKDSSSDQVRKQLQDIQQNEHNLERELDRVLELFKRLKMENALEQNIQKLEELSKRQEDLADEKKEGGTRRSDIEKGQSQIKEEFKEYRDKMDEVEQMNQELKQPQAIEDYEMDERLIQRVLNDIEQQMKNEGENSENPPQNSPPKNQTQKKQRNAAQQMKSLGQKLSNMRSGMQMEMMQVNLDQLRDILDNLVKLSFNQEELMTEMRKVNQSDPRFLELSQAQLKLKDDAKVIQDSLLSLAERVVQLSSFITREVGSIHENIDEALTYLKDRNRSRALSSQQFAMTSVNNLALLLDDTMQQMQMTLSEAMGNPRPGQQQQKGLPDLQQLQEQFGEQLNKLKRSGKQGRQLSEELAHLAAEQEMIRRQLEQIKQAEDGKPKGGTGGDDLQRAIQQMEQNEIDLVNKRLTQQLVNRQQSILTRMLKAEKAQREQEQEEEREAELPSVFSREIPPQFEEYLKMKQKEIELLKTIPLELNPFYKKEVNDYFRRISFDTE